jgi:hypothetical protein
MDSMDPWGFLKDIKTPPSLYLLNREKKGNQLRKWKSQAFSKEC